jgi:hypothetical protein
MKIPMYSPLHARPPERERELTFVGRWRNPCSSGRREARQAARGAEMAAAERRSAVLGEGDGGGDLSRVGASRGQGRETDDFFFLKRGRPRCVF